MPRSRVPSVLIALILLLGGAWWITGRGAETDALGGADLGDGAPARVTEAELVGSGGGKRQEVLEDVEEPLVELPGEEEVDSSGLLLFLSGRVVDSEGAPVPGVRVERRLDHATSYNGFDFDRAEDGPPVQSQETDEVGEFRFQLPGGQVSLLSAWSPGRARVLQAGCPPGDHVELVLPAAAVIEGFVTRSKDESPVRGARVRVFHGPGEDSIFETRTDVSGHYRLEELYPGSGGLQVIPEREAMPRWIGIELTAGEVLRRDVAVDVGWVLAGQVRDARTRAPIAGAEVSCWSFLGKNVRTDAQGLYRLEGARERPGTLTARAEGYGVNEISFDGAGEDLDLELEPGRGVRGRVVDPAGVPIDGARVSAAGMEGEEGITRREWITETTGTDGRFELGDLRVDLDLVLHLRATGRADKVVLLDHDTREVGDVVMGAGSIAAGQVIGASGAPAAGVGIDLLGPADRQVPGSLEPFLLSRITASDGNGRFQLLDLAPGAWRVRLLAPGGRAVEESLHLDPGEVRRDIEWRLPGGQSLRGLVREAGGVPQEGASVTLRSEEGDLGARPVQRTDAAGAFSFDDLPHGTWTLIAVPPEAEQNAAVPLLTVALPGQRTDGSFVEVVLPRADAWIEGEVVDADGGPVPQALVSRDTGDARLHGGVLADEEGLFRIQVPSTGLVTLRVWPTTELEARTRNMTSIEWHLRRRVVDVATPAAILPGLAPGTRDIRIRLED